MTLEENGYTFNWARISWIGWPLRLICGFLHFLSFLILTSNLANYFCYFGSILFVIFCSALSPLHKEQVGSIQAPLWKLGGSPDGPARTLYMWIELRINGPRPVLGMGQTLSIHYWFVYNPFPSLPFSPSFLLLQTLFSSRI